jgi:hypothetical protein
LVGYLGEKTQHNWWPSGFYAPTSAMFLNPVFPRTSRLAGYRGVVEAARRVHDEHIGIGRVFHLFRLPDEIEHELHRAVLAGEGGGSAGEPPASLESAMDELARLANGGLSAPEGPVKVGTRRHILDPDTIQDIARHYQDAFQREIRCFPYLTAA